MCWSWRNRRTQTVSRRGLRILSYRLSNETLLKTTLFHSHWFDIHVLKCYQPLICSLLLNDVAETTILLSSPFCVSSSCLFLFHSNIIIYFPVNKGNITFNSLLDSSMHIFGYIFFNMNVHHYDNSWNFSSNLNFSKESSLGGATNTYLLQQNIMFTFKEDDFILLD